MKNETAYIPQEIIKNILVRLPVKSLIRFQSVCKAWKNMFKTPSFIAEHLHRSTQQNPLLVVDCVISESNPWYLCSLDREMQVGEFQNPHIIDSLMLSWSRVYSSHGLLCVEIVSKPQHSFWLWNPSIRVIRQVPKSLNNYGGEYFSVGFGFSPIDNDYKIVKLLTSDYLVVQVEVYALRTGLWRKVAPGDLEGVFVSSPSRFTCNGAIFWFGIKEGTKRLIVLFDMAMEVFTFIPFPIMTATLESWFSRLTMHENKLAMLIENSESYLIDLWVLEECTDASRERWSWTKIYTTRPHPCRFSIIPEIIWRNEIIFSVDLRSEYLIEGRQENHESKVVLCNLTTDEFNIFAIPKCSYSHQIFDYVESLVLLDNIHT